MDMDTTALRWFQSVADGMTVTEVSELEAVTQPGVSRALARLEDELGTALLQRSGRTLRMTQAGAAFKRHVDALLHELDDGLAAVSQLVDPETGRVTVAFQLSFGGWLIPHVLAGFHRHHPNVRFELRHLSEDDVAELSRPSVDLAITVLSAPAADLTWARLFTQPLRLAVPPHHRLVGQREVELAQLADEPFVALAPSWSLRRLTDLLCERAGITANVVLEANDLPTVHGLVAAGLGVAIVPAPRTETVDTVSLADPAAQREVGLAWPTNRALLPSARLFRDYLLDRRTLAGLTRTPAVPG